MSLSDLPRKFRAALVSTTSGPVPGKACTVTIIDGASEPVRQSGGSWHYETKGGRRIHHPSAYSKCGWSNMVYCPASPDEIVVGLQWALANGYVPPGQFGEVAALASTV